MHGWMNYAQMYKRMINMPIRRYVYQYFFREKGCESVCVCLCVKTFMYD